MSRRPIVIVRAIGTGGIVSAGRAGRDVRRRCAGVTSSATGGWFWFPQPVRRRGGVESELCALTPSGLRTANGRASAASYLRDWFGEPDQLAHLSSDVRLIEDRLHVGYRFRAHMGQWYLIEQHAYCSVEHGKITQVDLLCSGFRPEAPSGDID